MNKVYLAGPLFTRGEQGFNEMIRLLFESNGFDVRLPQNFCRGLAPNWKAVAFKCIQQLNDCNIVVACLDGPDADSGTSFEVGYAFARDLPVIGYRTDLRTNGGEIDGYNAMFTLCDELVTLREGDDVEQLVKLAQAYLQWH